MYARSDVNVKVERSSTFTFTRGFSHIVSILFTHVKPAKVYVRTYAHEKLRDSGNPVQIAIAYTEAVVLVFFGKHASNFENGSIAWKRYIY